MPQKQFRLDIQGLRALAVALVVVFHLAPSALPGGYIGVDVFFVISGFLITAHLLREVTATGTVRLTEFWARRVRRLLPAALLVLAVSALAVYAVLPTTARDQNFTEIAFASFYLLNWRLAADSVDYLAADNAASIAQHYWSLSVEEQFYLFWPLIILLAVWAASRSSRTSPRTAVAVALVLVLGASLAFSVIETARSQPSAYFITTTRAWEFAAGGLVALLPAARLRGWGHVLCSWLALAAIVGAAFRFDGASPFPGWIALIPVLGTAGLLWLGDSSSPWSPQYLAKAGPVQFAGDTSYSIYLWHWPLIVVATALLGRAPGWIWGAAIAVATLALAAATKYLVEDPVRRAPGMLSRRPATFSLMAASIAAILALTVTPVAVGNAQTAERQAAIASESADAESCFGAYAILNDCAEPYAVTGTVDPSATQDDVFWNTEEYSRDCSSQSFAGRAEVRCDVDRGSDTTVMLLGDSHMYSLYPGFAALAETREWNLGMRARSGCPGHGVVSTGSSAERQERCASWSAEVQDEIAGDESIDTVVFTAYEINYEGTEAQAAELFAALRQAGKEILIVRDVPGMEGEPAPACVEAAGGVPDPCASPLAFPETWVSTVGADTGIPMIDPREVLCDEELCHAVIGGTIVYQDTAHVAGTFARTLAPWLEQHLVQ
ncbi:acyltransferase family protein [Leucobacter sp.]